MYMSQTTCMTTIIIRADGIPVSVGESVTIHGIIHIAVGIPGIGTHGPTRDITRGTAVLIGDGAVIIPAGMVVGTEVGAGQAAGTTRGIQDHTLAITITADETAPEDTATILQEDTQPQEAMADIQEAELLKAADTVRAETLAEDATAVIMYVHQDVTVQDELHQQMEDTVRDVPRQENRVSAPDR